MLVHTNRTPDTEMIGQNLIFCKNFISLPPVSIGGMNGCVNPVDDTHLIFMEGTDDAVEFLPIEVINQGRTGDLDSTLTGFVVVTESLDPVPLPGVGVAEQGPNLVTVPPGLFDDEIGQVWKLFLAFFYPGLDMFFGRDGVFRLEHVYEHGPLGRAIREFFRRVTGIR